MTARERVLTALKHKEPDILPWDLGGMRSTGIMAVAYAKLRRALKLPLDSIKLYDVGQHLAWVDEDIRRIFGIDVIALDTEKVLADYINGWKPYRLLDEELELLKGKRLDKDYFNTLLTGGDPVRDLLQWLDLGDAFQTTRGANEWKAFVEVCKSQLAFNPQVDGVLAGASKLATREGPWHSVWERYSEAPKRYPNIPSRIRQCKPPDLGIFDTPAEKLSGWPQWNEDQEKSLQHDLLALNNLPAHEARKRMLELEKNHAPRRELVWAELGESPLALAAKHLAVVAEVTKTALAAGSVSDLQVGYANHGWRADDAVLSALACVDKVTDVDAATSAIRATYLPWIEESARYLQKLVYEAAYPGGGVAEAPAVYRIDRQCTLFVDGLRFDTARRLAAALELRGYQIGESICWTALPSVTATGKAAASPVRTKISGTDDCDDFEPCVSATGQSLKGGYHLKKLLNDNHWKVLDRTENGDGQGNAWCEFGDIDSEGHARGWKLAKHIDPLLAEIAERIAALLAAGWNSVRVVTDHGWLLMPGKLPTIQMSKDLTDNKWGRCASIKPGASTGERLYPWFWNPNQQFALADGVSCYGKSVDYNHGGLSLQECLTLDLVVTRSGCASAKQVAEVTDIAWKGLRCTVAVDGQFANLSLDIRAQAGDSPLQHIAAGGCAEQPASAVSPATSIARQVLRDMGLFPPLGILVGQLCMSTRSPEGGRESVIGASPNRQFH